MAHFVKVGSRAELVEIDYRASRFASNPYRNYQYRILPLQLFCEAGYEVIELYSVHPQAKSLPRASHEATLFTDDMTKLNPQLGADVSKTSALEINQTSPVAQGFGIGL